MSKRKVNSNNVVGNIKVHGSKSKAPRRRRRWQIDLAKKIQSEHAEGLSIDKLMERHGYGRASIYNYINMKI